MAANTHSHQQSPFTIKSKAFASASSSEKNVFQLNAFADFFFFPSVTNTKVEFCCEPTSITVPHKLP
jgi:hypothetical protein